uniref:Globin family profile domain-containing protein n=1 Tax=Trichuris muris TaxID=70415 RepID=A0A5S6QQN3_TRIMR
MGNRQSVSTQGEQRRLRFSIGSGSPCVHAEASMKEEDLKELSEPETKTLLQSTWPADFSELYELGLELSHEMSKLITKNSAYRERSLTINSPATTADEEVSARLRTQSLRFVRVLQLALTNCDSLPQVRTQMYKVGGRNLFGGLADNERRLFKGAVLKTMQARIDQQNKLTEGQKTKALHAWDTVAGYIVDQWSSNNLSKQRRKSTPY